MFFVHLPLMKEAAKRNSCSLIVYWSLGESLCDFELNRIFHSTVYIYYYKFWKKKQTWSCSKLLLKVDILWTQPDNEMFKTFS